MPVQKTDIYGCSVSGEGKCDCLVEILQDCNVCDASSYMCCGKPMEKIEPKTAAQEGKEKHVPVIEKIDGGFKVTVGGTPHPMESDHWIQWIELTVGKQVLREYKDPGDEPTATFMVACGCCGSDCGEPTAREHCNKHGLWSS